MTAPRLKREVDKPSPTPATKLFWLALVICTAAVWGAIVVLALAGWGVL